MTLKYRAICIFSLAITSLALCIFAPTAFALEKDAVFLALDNSDRESGELPIRTALGYAVRNGADRDIQFMGENLNLAQLKDTGTLYLFSHGAPGQINAKSSTTSVKSVVDAITDPKLGLRPTFKGTIRFMTCYAGNKPDIPPNAKSVLEEFAEVLRTKARTGITVTGPTGPAVAFVGHKLNFVVLEDDVPGDFIAHLSGVLVRFYSGRDHTLNQADKPLLNLLGVDLTQFGNHPIELKNFEQRVGKYQPQVSPKNLILVLSALLGLEDMAEIEDRRYEHLSQLDFRRLGIDYDRLGLPQLKKVQKIFKPNERAFVQIVT
jgi:hypothetical protein